MGANGDAGTLADSTTPDSRGRWNADVFVRTVYLHEALPRDKPKAGSSDHLPCASPARDLKLPTRVIDWHEHADSDSTPTCPPPDAILTLAPAARADEISMGSDRFAPSTEPGRMS